MPFSYRPKLHLRITTKAGLNPFLSKFWEVLLVPPPSVSPCPSTGAPKGSFTEQPIKANARTHKVTAKIDKMYTVSTRRGRQVGETVKE